VEPLNLRLLFLHSGKSRQGKWVTWTAKACVNIINSGPVIINMGINTSSVQIIHTDNHVI
jgi:hypothetical protein